MTIAFLFLALLGADAPWQGFSAWFSEQGTPGAPAHVLKAYATRSQTRGMAEPEVQARVKDMQEYLTAHPREALPLHFYRISTWTEAPCSRGRSAFLVRTASTRKPGRALDSAMGQGRNSVWLANAGWTVSRYGISDEAPRQANAAAFAASLRLDTKLASHDKYELVEAQWDLIVMSFAFTRLSDEPYMKRVRAALRHGGVLATKSM